ncbi:MAG: polysaccharide deacetylase family protein [Bacilli bacterium]|nr:polysaccharide deacetylase family protein [Bacilli bacterium]
MPKYGKTKIIIAAILSIIFIVVFYSNYLNKKNEEKLEQERIAEEKLKDINKHYNKFVKSNLETDLYILENNEYKMIGKIGKDVELTLKEMDITSDTDYFMIDNFDGEYYIKYDSVTPIEELSKESDRYKNYILFNENVITKDKTLFYKNDHLMYELDIGVNLPIIMKDGNKIYVEYQNKLVYVLDSEIDNIISSNNTNKEVAQEIPTIVYHFIYNPEVEECNQIICHTLTQVQSHIDYLKSESYFTPTMQEFEMFIDGKLLLPKNSVVITIDDGWFGDNARDIFTSNHVNATIFLITSAYGADYYKTEYLETHSHSNDLHTQGICPTGQGGAIQCSSREFLLEDLRLSRERTFNSTVFCYPFYEYNDYSIGILKEAGFTMAFGGSYAGGHFKMPIGGDKYQIPRFTLLNDTTVADLKEILNS